MDILHRFPGALLWTITFPVHQIVHSTTELLGVQDSGHHKFLMTLPLDWWQWGEHPGKGCSIADFNWDTWNPRCIQKCGGRSNLYTIR